MLPRYDDLRPLFKEVRNLDYKKDDYIRHFTIRISENLAKIKRVEEFYRKKVLDAPKKIFEVLEAQRKRLEQLSNEAGAEASPEILEEV